MGFRHSILAISPPWLTARVAGGIQYTIGTAIDAIGDWMIYGTQARFPGIGTPEALGYIGNDRLIDRGPAEEDDTYAVRLREAVETWKGAGNAFTLIKQLATFFLPDDPPPMRLVSNGAVWHELSGGVVTKTIVSPSNWIWGSHTAEPRWWRGWIIIDSTLGPWVPDVWGDYNPDATDAWWGDGGMWGSDMSEVEILTLLKIIRKWKSANNAVTLIVTFDSGLFLVGNTSPPNPNGDYDDPSARSPDAIYSGVIT